MSASDMGNLSWFKSSYSATNGACVEVAYLPNGVEVVDVLVERGEDAVRRALLSRGVHQPLHERLVLHQLGERLQQ